MLEEIGFLNITYQAPRFNLRAMLDRGMDEVKKHLEKEAMQIIENQEYKDKIIAECVAEMKKEISERAKSMGRFYASQILKFMEMDLANAAWEITKNQGGKNE